MAKPCLYMYKANIKLLLRHALMESFLVFKYVILILMRIGIHFWDFGEKLNYLYGFGEQRQILLRSRGKNILPSSEIRTHDHDNSA